MLSDEEEANEVIKVSNLVAKFESEIRRQNADERLIHTVRQVQFCRILTFLLQSINQK